MIFRTLERLVSNSLGEADRSDVRQLQDRLDMIAGILRVLRDFEDMCDKHPEFDELELLRQFAAQEGVDASEVDDDRVVRAAEQGLRWIIETQADGGWGWPSERRVEPDVFALLRRDAAVSLTWDTAVAVLALADWAVHSIPGRGHLSADEWAGLRAALKAGRQWLLDAQGEPDGGWSELGRQFRETTPLPGHAIETVVALWGLRASENDRALGLKAPAETVENGLRFFREMQNPDGGTASQRGEASDIKASGAAVLSALTFGRQAATVVRSNVKWLLGRHARGNWGAPRRGQFIDPAFYAVSALQVYTQAFPDRATREVKGVDDAIQATIDWYLDEFRFRRDERKSGWAWRDVENTSAALSVLLNAGVPSLLPTIQKGVDSLLSAARGSEAWGAETPLAVIALTRYLKPGSRLSERTFG